MVAGEGSEARNKQKGTYSMQAKFLAIAAATGLLIATTSVGFAQSSTPSNTPGHEMQRKGSVKGQPGASGYSPGHEMQQKGSKPGEPGASGYAPGHQTTGQNPPPPRTGR